MTSANVTYYSVYKGDELIKEHRQNCMCKLTIRDRLERDHFPTSDFTIVARWPDENEVDHFTEPMKLTDYLAGKKLVWVEED